MANLGERVKAKLSISVLGCPRVLGEDHAFPFQQLLFKTQTQNENGIVIKIVSPSSNPKPPSFRQPEDPSLFHFKDSNLLGDKDDEMLRQYI